MGILDVLDHVDRESGVVSLVVDETDLVWPERMVEIQPNGSAVRSALLVPGRRAHVVVAIDQLLGQSAGTGPDVEHAPRVEPITKIVREPAVDGRVGLDPEVPVKPPLVPAQARDVDVCYSQSRGPTSHRWLPSSHVAEKNCWTPLMPIWKPIATRISPEKRSKMRTARRLTAEVRCAAA